MSPGRVAAAACAALAVAALAACGDEEPAAPQDPPIACTQIGCRSGVGFHLDEVPERAVRARACVADRCRTVRLREEQPPPFVFVPVAGPVREREVPVSLRLSGTGDRTLVVTRIDVRLRVSRPNGPRCPPACVQAGVRYDATARRLYAAPGLSPG